MKLNYLPNALTYSIEDVRQSNERIDDLCGRIEPVARKAFLNTVKRQAKEGSGVLLEEAKYAISNLLADSSYQRPLDEASVELWSHLAKSLETGFSPNEEPDQDWIAERSLDLARAIVGFWMNLGPTDAVRYEKVEEVLDAFAGAPTELFVTYQEIYKAFGLEDAEAQQLLNGLNTGALAEVIVREMESAKAKPESKSARNDKSAPPEEKIRVSVKRVTINFDDLWKVALKPWPKQAFDPAKEAFAKVYLDKVSKVLRKKLLARALVQIERDRIRPLAKGQFHLSKLQTVAAQKRIERTIDAMAHGTKQKTELFELNTQKEQFLSQVQVLDK